MAILITSWDDATIADMQMAELMQKYQIETTFYWPTYIKEYKNYAVTSSWLSPIQCKELAKTFKIGSYSVSKKSFKKLNLAQVTTEIHESKKYLEDLTGKEITDFAYPKNSQSNLVRALLQGAGYKTARTNAIGNIKACVDLYNIQPSVQVGIDRVEYRNVSWEIYSDQLLSKCNENSVFHIFGSSYDIESYNDWDNLETLIKKILGK